MLRKIIAHPRRIAASIRRGSVAPADELCGKSQPLAKPQQCANIYSVAMLPTRPALGPTIWLRDGARPARLVARIALVNVDCGNFTQIVKQIRVRRVDKAARHGTPGVPRGGRANAVRHMQFFAKHRHSERLNASPNPGAPLAARWVITQPQMLVWSRKIIPRAFSPPAYAGESRKMRRPVFCFIPVQSSIHFSWRFKLFACCCAQSLAHAI